MIIFDGLYSEIVFTLCSITRFIPLPLFPVNSFNISEVLSQGYSPLGRISQFTRFTGISTRAGAKSLFNTEQCPNNSKNRFTTCLL